MFLQTTDIPSGENQPDTSDQKLNTDLDYDEAEKELNSNILDITLKIKDHYPELSKYLEEMPVTIPVDKKPEITLEGLRTYYNTLKVLLNNYIKEHQ